MGFLLQAFGVKKIPTLRDRISQGYDNFIKTYNFNSAQKKQLNKFKKYLLLMLKTVLDLQQIVYLTIEFMKR